MLRIRQLRRQFPGTGPRQSGLHNIHLDVAPRSIHSILGPSGAGKSTFLRILAGLESPDSGTVSWNNADLLALRPEHRPVCFVPQESFLFPGRSVEENLSLGLRLRRIPAGESRDRILHVAEQLHLTALLQYATDNLSGGERRRVTLGRALVLRPEILLLDEPVSSIDAALRQPLIGDLSRLPSQFQVTVLHVTHDLQEAASLADSVSILVDGSILQTGHLESLYRHPKSEGIASLTGPHGIQSWNGCYTEAMPEPGFRAGSFFARLVGLESINPSRQNQSIPLGETVLAIRPEDVRTGPAAPGIAAFEVHATVMASRSVGWQTFTEFECSGFQIRQVHTPGNPVRPGQPVTLHWNLSETHFFRDSNHPSSGGS